MSASLAFALLQAAVSLLASVQSNPALPPTLADSAMQLSQQAMTQAEAILFPAQTSGSSPTASPLPATVNALIVPVSLPTISAPTLLAPGVAPARPASIPTCAMRFTPASILQGESATLSWTSTNAVIGFVASVGTTSPQGSADMYPQQTAAFIGHFSGAGGIAYCAAQVNVQPLFGTTALGEATNSGTSTSLGSPTVTAKPQQPDVRNPFTNVLQ